MWGFAAQAAQAAQPDGVERLYEAQAVFEPLGERSGSVVATTPVSTTVTLPHRWDQSFPHQGGRAHYRVTLPDQPADQPLAIFLPRVGNQAVIRLDGREIAHFGVLGDAASDAVKAPVWISIPTVIAPRGTAAVLDIEVTAQAGRWGGLSEVYYGPAQQVQPLYERNSFWRQEVGQLIVVGLLIMGAISGGLWLRQRDAQFGFFALAAIFGVVRMADRLMPIPPIPWPWWGGVTAMSFALHMIFVAQFAVHVVALSSRWTRYCFTVSAVLASVASMLSFVWSMPLLWTVTLGLLAVPGCLALGLVLWRVWTTHSMESVLMAVAGFIVVLAGLRDFFFVRLWSGGNATFSIMPMAAFVLVLFMAWIIVERYSRQVRQFRSLTQSLEQRVADREGELRQTYEALQAEKEQQAALQERQRIMRDIHDGVGAHLVGLLSMMRKGDVPAMTMEEHAKAALDELRIAIDALQPVNGDLATVLATLRYRLQPRFEAAGLAVQWEVAALPQMANLTPQTVLHIQRLLSEAFTNVLRHARARRIEVRAYVSGDPVVLVLEVADDGQGWPVADGTRQGHGLSNMQVRAAAIGATLTLDERPGGGARVRLQFPMP